MKWRRRFSGEASRIEHCAAEWVVKSDRDLSAAEQDEFLQWLGADPRHGESFARCRGAWREFNLISHWRPEHSAEPNPDLLARSTAYALRNWLGALGAAAGLLLGFFLWHGPWPARSSPGKDVPASVLLQSNEQRILEDGSVVNLTGDAAIAVHFTQSERTVSLLRGEASFTVAKNKLRPFVVHAGGVDVRAVGTVFSVSLDSVQVAVLVSEGQVHVSQVGPLVVAGQRAVVSLAPRGPLPHVVEVAPQEMARLLDGQRRLNFSSRSLAEVVAEFNRHNRVQLIFGDPELAELPIVASFRPDNIEGFAHLLELSTDIRTERRSDGNIILRRAR